MSRLTLGLSLLLAAANLAAGDKREEEQLTAYTRWEVNRETPRKITFIVVLAGPLANSCLQAYELDTGDQPHPSRPTIRVKAEADSCQQRNLEVEYTYKDRDDRHTIQFKIWVEGREYDTPSVKISLKEAAK